MKGLTGGIEFLFKKNKVEWLKGRAAFTVAPTPLTSRAKATPPKNIMIATGSSVTPLPGVEVDNAKGIIVDSTGALELAEGARAPSVVIGGGVIGLELGSVWRRLGAKVTVVEFLDQMLPGMDGDVRKEAAQDLQEAGLRIQAVNQGHRRAGQGQEGYADASNPPQAARRKASRPIAYLSPSAAAPIPMASRSTRQGLTVNARGQIEIDHDFRTTVPGIWAIGDVVPGPMLAHKAEDEGIAVRRKYRGTDRHRQP